MRLQLFFLHIQAGEQRLLLIELRLVQLKLRLGALFVVLRLLDKLRRAGDLRPQQIVLPLALELIAQQIGLGGVDRRLGLADQRALHVLLIGEIGERGLRRGAREARPAPALRL